MFGLIKLKKNGVRGSLRIMLFSWRYGVGVDFVFAVGMLIIGRRSVEDIVMYGRNREGREGNGSQVVFVFVFGNDIVISGRYGREEGWIVLGNGIIVGGLGGLGGFRMVSGW